MSGALPALVAMWVVDRLDAKRPEPPRLRRLVAFVGMISVIPALVAELAISGWLDPELTSLATFRGAGVNALLAATVEEACKILVVYWVVWRRPEFDERMDGIVYASRAGLGFALIENILYLRYADSLGGQLELWVMRAVLAVPGHAIWTGVIGALAARRRFDGKGLGLVGGYLLAVALHGSYDACAFFQQPLLASGHATLAASMMPAVIAITIAGFLLLRALARSALRLDDADARLR